jgi:hypothetical protein
MPNPERRCRYFSRRRCVFCGALCHGHNKSGSSCKCARRTEVCFGSNASIPPCPRHVRFSPDRDRCADIPDRQLRDKRRCTQSRLAEIGQIGAAQPQGLPNISRPRGAGVSLRALAELAAELSHQRPAVRHADLGTCSRTFEPIAKPVSTFAGHLNDRPGTGAIAPARL